MLPNLQVVLFMIRFIIQCFKKVFICYFTISNIIVYYSTIISNILNKMVHCIELKIVKSWSIKLKVNWLVLLKCYLCFF